MLADVQSHLSRLSSKQNLLQQEIDPRRESKLLDFFVRIIPRALNAERCSIFIHDPQNQKIWLKLGSGVKEHGIEVSVSGSIVGDVISSGKSVIATDLRSRAGVHKNIDTQTGFVTTEVICVPIRSKERGEVTGAIEVLNKKNGGKFDESDKALLEDAGEHLQRIVDSIFLSQEVFGVTEKAIKIARRVVVSSIVIFITLVFALMGLYAAAPILFA